MSAASDPPTPLKSATSSNFCVSSSPSSGLEDIHYLLYLETLKRFREDEANIRKQVDEKMRQYQEVKSEYLKWYAKYVQIIKLCKTRIALEHEDHQLSDDQCELTKRNIASITEKINTNSMTDYIAPETLANFKQQLVAVESHENLEHLQQDAVEHKASVRAINSAMETVEATVESAIVQGFDYFLTEVQMDNFEK